MYGMRNHIGQKSNTKLRSLTSQWMRPGYDELGQLQTFNVIAGSESETPSFELSEHRRRQCSDRMNTPVSLLVNEGRFTLQRRSPPVMNSRGILKFDWPRATLLCGDGLQYSQESFGRQHCTWVKIWHGCQCGDAFFQGEFSGGQVFWATSKPWTRNLTYGELQLE